MFGTNFISKVRVKIAKAKKAKHVEGVDVNANEFEGNEEKLEKTLQHQVLS